MEKAKSRILIILILFIGMIIMGTKSSFAIVLDGNLKEGEFAEWLAKSSNIDDFMRMGISSLKGKRLAVGGTAIANPSAACMYHRQSNAINGTGWAEIIGVIDIDEDELKIDGKVIELTNSQEKQISKVGKSIYVAYTDLSGNQVTTGKNALKYTFGNYLTKIFNDKKITSMAPFYSGTVKESSSGSGTLSAAQSTGVINYTYKKLEKDTEYEPRIKKSGQKRYLGPFKVRFSGYDMDKLEVTVNGSKVSVNEYYIYKDGTYTKHSGTNIPTSKSFYIKLENGLDVNSQWKVELSSSKGAKKYKARMLLLSNPGANGQNLGLYVAKEVPKKPQVSWENEGVPVEPDPGALEIIKKNKIGSINLPGAKFTVKDLKANKYIIAEKVSDNKWEFVKYAPGYTSATKFEVGLNGLIVEGLDAGTTYEVTERKAPANYKIDSDRSKKVTIVANQTKDVVFYNPEKTIPDSGKTLIEVVKEDKDSQDPIEGVSFELQMTYYYKEQTTITEVNGVQVPEITKKDTRTVTERITTDAGGIAEYEIEIEEDLDYIDCVVREVYVPRPYNINDQDTTPRTFRIYPTDSEITTGYEIKFENQAYGKLTILKKNQHGTPLSGITFNVAYLDGNTKKYISGFSNGEVTSMGGSPYNFTTDSSGTIQISKIPLYGSDECEYIVEEVGTSNSNSYNINYQTSEKKEVIVEVTPSGVTAGMENIETGNASIKKVNDDSNKNPLGNVYFVLSTPSGEYIRINNADYLNGIINIEKYEDIEFVESREEATTFITDATGSTVINNIPTGTYTFEEIINYNYGHKNNVGNKYKIEVKSGNNDIKVENHQALGNVEIRKLDERALAINKEIEMEDVEFKIRITEGSYVSQYSYLQLVDSSGTVVSKLKGSATIHTTNKAQGGYYQVNYVPNKADATTFVTDKNGKININNLEVYKGKDVKYEYYVDEIAMGHIYEMYYDVIEQSDDYKFELNDNQTEKVPLLITNYQLYVDLTGYVWEDIQSGKDKMRDDLFKDTGDTDPDKRVKKDDLGGGNYKGITVNLVRNGNILATTETDDNGTYFFPSQKKTTDSKRPEVKVVDPSGEYKIWINNLKEYSIEFLYNGLKYESVDIPDDNATYWAKGNSSKAKDNDENRRNINNAFYLIKGENTKTGRGTTGSTGNGTTLTYTNPDVGHSSALVQNTKYTKESLVGSVSLDGKVDVATVNANTRDSEFEIIHEPGVLTIENINLGIFERPQADLMIATDLENIQLTINGYTHRYDYFKREPYFNNLQKQEGEDGYDAMLDIFSVSAGNRYSDGYRKLSYVREIYPSYLAYTATYPDKNYPEGEPEKDKSLRVFVTYIVSVTNESSLLNNTVKLRNYCDPNYTLVPNRSDGEWEEKDDIKGAKVYETEVNVSVSARDVAKIKLTYELSRKAVIGLMEKELKTQTNTTEILSYTTEDRNGIYASIDRDSAPGNSDYGVDNTYEDDIDSAPDLVIKKSEKQKTLTGTVFEDNTDSEDNTDIVDKERIGNGKYDDGENRVNNVKVELLKKDGTIAQLYKIGDNAEAKDPEDAKKNTSSDGTYEFEGLIPDIYYLKYTYGTGEEGGEIIETTIGDKAVEPEKYKSTIVKYDSVKELLKKQTEEAITKESNEKDYWKYPENDDQIKDKSNTDINAYWYEEEQASTYSASIDNYVRRLSINDYLSKFGYGKKSSYDAGISDNSKKLDGKNWLYVMTAQTPIMSIAIEEKDNDATDSDYTPQSSYETKFGIVRRPRQDFKVTKEISWVKVILANGQILLEGNPSGDISKYLTYPERGRVKIEMDSEILQGATLEITYDIKVSNLSNRNYDTRGYYSFGEDRDEGKIVKTTIQLMDYMDKEISYYNDGEWEVIKTEGISDLDLSDSTKEFSNYNYIQQVGTITLAPGDTNTVKIKATKLLTTAKDMDYDNKVEFFKVENPVGRFYDKEDTPRDPQTPGNYGDEKEECDNIENPSRAELTIVPPTGQTRIYYAIGISCLVLLVGGIVLIKKKVLK